jgi:hypothetical protein
MADKAKLVGDRLAWQMESWSSIEFTVVEELSNNEVAAGDQTMYRQATFKRRYIETAAGQRREESYTLAPEKVEMVYVEYFDGTRGASAAHPNGIASKPMQVIIKESYAHEATMGGNARPYPLRCFYVGKVPLQRALTSATYDGEIRQLGRTCSVFLFPNTVWAYKPILIEYTIDDETGVPVKVVGYNQEADRQANRPIWSWTAKTLDTVDGRAFPLESQVFELSNPENGAASIRMRCDINLSELKYNKEYASSEFSAVIGPGVNVFDTVKKSVYHTKDQDLTSRPSEAPRGETIQATQPQHWTESASTILLVAGLLVVAAVLVIKVRYGRSEKGSGQI